MKKKYDYRYLIPAVVVVAVMTQIPFLLTIIFSTLRWNLSRPDQGRNFVGLANYIYWLKIDFSAFRGVATATEFLSKIPPFYHFLWQTVIITGCTLLFCSVLGFLLALLLDHEIPGINIARTLMMGPFFVMSTATGVIWKTTIFNTKFGWYGVLCDFLHITPIDFISYHPLAVIVVLITWQWMPFFVLILLAGLQGVSGEVIDSMKVDGVGWLQGIIKIKLPLIMNHLQVAIMLGLVFLIKEFGLILTTTMGGPGSRSYNLPYAVYMEIFSANQVGRAGALATMTVILTLVLVNMIYKSIARRNAQFS
jgi:sorbitol/mannitol transport system permease protein